MKKYVSEILVIFKFSIFQLRAHNVIAYDETECYQTDQNLFNKVKPSFRKLKWKYLLLNASDRKIIFMQSILFKKLTAGVYTVL